MDVTGWRHVFVASRHAHWFLFFFDEVERVLKGFYIAVNLRLAFIQANSYIINTFYVIVDLNTNICFIYLFCTNNHRMKHQKYDKLNELLNQKSMSNQNLLTELRYLKKSYFGEDRSYFPSTDNAETTGFINQMEKYIDFYVHNHEQSGPILLSSQNAIFREIIGLQIQSNQLKQQLQIERNKSSRLAKQLEKMKANSDAIFNDDLRRQKNLLFRPQQFQRIKNEIKEIANRIEAFGSTDDQIESKIQVLKAKNEELQHRKLQLEERIEGRNILLQNKHRLVVFNRPEEEQQQEINGQQIIAVLKARLQLEAQIEAETAQKEQFIQLLLDFKNKSAEVMNKNSQLKQQIKQKGLELSDQ